MGISLKDKSIIFTSDSADVPDLEYRLVKRFCVGDTLIAAVWEANQIPFYASELCYYLYEDVEHHSKAQYQYWNKNRYAGCLLKPLSRSKIGLRDIKLEVIQEGLQPIDSAVSLLGDQVVRA